MLALIVGASLVIPPDTEMQDSASAPAEQSAAPSTNEPRTLADAVHGMERCDKAMKAFEVALKSGEGSRADIAAKAVPNACHEVSKDYYALTPPSETAEQEMAVDRCGDAYFAPEQFAEQWLRSNGERTKELLGSVRKNDTERAECLRLVKR